MLTLFYIYVADDLPSPAVCHPELVSGSKKTFNIKLFEIKEGYQIEFFMKRSDYYIAK